MTAMHTIPEEKHRHVEDGTAVRAALAERIARLVDGEGEQAAPGIGLNLVRLSAPTEAAAYMYEPSIAVIVQGRKRVVLGDSTHIYDESCFLLTSVNLPTITQVIQASAAKPYLSLLMKLDLALARQLIADIDLRNPDSRSPSSGSGMATGRATADMLDAFLRLIKLMERPDDIPYMGALIQREILYRILTSSQGIRLRHIVRIGTLSHRTAQAIAWLHAHLAEPLSIQELAGAAGMGVSTLYHHFRAMTAMSPLQYQKQLRLHEARRLMLVEAIDAGSAAFRVGYESKTQFSREYRRQFGEPPLRDIRALRAHVYRAQ
jgi:AraC-like DNA-binding protein